MDKVEKIIAEIRRLKTELQGYSAREVLDYIESYINLISREPLLPTDIDKAAEKWLIERKNLIREKYYPFEFNAKDIFDSFKAGGKWQEEKDQEIIKLAEDHAFLAGADWQKEQMMKGAVEGVVIYNDHPEYKYILVPYEKFNNGDKVHLIVLKTEESK